MTEEWDESKYPIELDDPNKMFNYIQSTNNELLKLAFSRIIDIEMDENGIQIIKISIKANRKDAYALVHCESLLKEHLRMVNDNGTE